MTIATGSRHNLAYVLESTFGTTPSSPGFTPIRHTGTTLGLSKDAVESEELREDRQIAHFRHGNKSVTGDINFEMSYGGLDDLIQATLCGTWSNNVLKAGTTRRSFTVERYHQDISKYLRSSGCQFNYMSLNVAPNSMVTGSFGIIGSGFTTSGSALGSSTYSAESTTAPFDSFTGSITEGGSAIAVITALELQIDNGMEALYVVGSADTLLPSIGKSSVTGSVTAYFENTTLIDKFISETSSAIQFTLTDAAGNDYIFSLPNIKYNSGNPEVSGPEAITVTLDFVALYNSSDASQIKITRVPS
ncbi:hypothetical protein [uncultured Mediterranean phage uvMED]|nr:hypothetical protein [uncultured Mediterranean phage uvMED]